MGIFDSFKELIGNKISDIAPEELVNKAGELLDGEQVSDQAQQAVDSVTEAAGVDHITDQASDLAQQGTELGQEAINQGSEAVQQVTEQANEATESLTEKAQGLFSSFTDKWK
jgi:2-keto-3-deoxy-L-rhamnonate aldolase RhmA